MYRLKASIDVDVKVVIAERFATNKTRVTIVSVILNVAVVGFGLNDGFGRLHGVLILFVSHKDTQACTISTHVWTFRKHPTNRHLH
jgi:hypothetical protein